MIRTLVIAAALSALSGAAMAKDPVHVSLVGKDRATYAAEIAKAADLVCRDSTFTLAYKVACQKALTRELVAQADASQGVAQPSALAAAASPARR